jgi:hypothetical protein
LTTLEVHKDPEFIGTTLELKTAPELTGTTLEVNKAPEFIRTTLELKIQINSLWNFDTTHILYGNYSD